MGRCRARKACRSGDHFMVTIRVKKATPVRFVMDERVIRLPRREGEVEKVRGLELWGVPKC